ncbi:hypothetical protein A2704_03505 [Candidatus Kaiserbacteria bacterium RIFCSPHIGHO2_01_FULL_54_36b]|uniref:Peptidoglycan binding-like domain-containing protein n=1 Tax=Candidatus Kaiserbacteria bacterium RIFCSPHIGHO2_01_FULL_54_36b TaxID=1798483 RepID=A0A1F6CQF9_9BACT|nr:MAG: hypothetical protein A2704_03505 [Candidatus Kaiserbacteria bacterium RIFCSPHIGHO2_01_FULL_54_36b]
MSTTTAPATVDYKVVVKNSRSAGPVYRGLLTDTLYNPSGTVMYNRSWDLETIVPGDEITLTYSVAFATGTAPGIYRNVARVTGQRNSPIATAPKIVPFEISKSVQILSSGQVLGVATSTPTMSASSIATAPESCVPLLTSYMGQGIQNDATQVMKLQTFLNTQGSQLPVTGYYGPMTTAAVKSFQLKYKDEILTPLGLLRPTGNVYGSTQRTINRINCGLPAQAVGGTARVAADTSQDPTIESLLAQLAALQALLASLQGGQEEVAQEGSSAAAAPPAEVAAPQRTSRPVAKPAVKDTPAAPLPLAAQPKKNDALLKVIGSWFSGKK